jgi:hypothetical protein
MDAAGALAGCGSASAHVVTFASANELTTVYRRVAPVDSGFWIDLETVPNSGAYQVPQPVDHDLEPGWAGNCPGCFAQNPLDASFRDQICVTGHRTLDTWLPTFCDVDRTVICEREPPGNVAQICTGGLCINLRAAFGAKRYLYVFQEANPDDARAACEGLMGGHLVILGSPEEREQLWHALAALSTPPAQFWIGLARGDAGWVWDDGTTLDAAPAPWGIGQPAMTGIDRAYLWQFASQSDSQLAHNTADGGVPLLPFVCELRN